MGSVIFRVLLLAPVVPLLSSIGDQAAVSAESPVTESHLTSINDLLRS